LPRYPDPPLPFACLLCFHSPRQTVRRLSLGSLNAAASNKPQLIREHLPALLPLLYSETEIKQELLRTVQMGPWKQIFDDGLETRKTAFETMYTLVSPSFLEREVGKMTEADARFALPFCTLARYVPLPTRIPTYLSRVVAGLADAPEIKGSSSLFCRSFLSAPDSQPDPFPVLPLLSPRLISAVISFLALSRLSLVAPASITQILDSIAPSFAETMKAFVPGKDSVKQDYDRHAEMQRSALRTIVSLSKLSSVGASPAFEQVVIATRRGEFSREWNELDH
jgi:cullin-associated NEDD8-dissociated protein 1